jgi:hypothetical protein
MSTPASLRGKVANALIHQLRKEWNVYQSLSEHYQNKQRSEKLVAEEIAHWELCAEAARQLGCVLDRWDMMTEE